MLTWQGNDVKKESRDTSGIPKKGARRPVPPGVLQSPLMVRGEAAHNRYVCRVELRFRDGRPLPMDVLRSPHELILWNHAAGTMKQDQLSLWQQNNPRHEIVLRPMDDASARSITNWNRQVRTSADIHNYWSIDLPRPDGRRDYVDMYQLLVQPQSNGPAAAGPGQVRAWIAKKIVFKDMLKVNRKPQVALSSIPTSLAPQVIMSPGGRQRLPAAFIGQDQAGRQLKAINELQSRSSGVMTNRALRTLSQQHEKWPFGAVAELFDNAVDAEASYVKVRLHSQSKSDDKAYLTFQDDGCGMDATTLRHMLREVGWTSKVGGRQAQTNGIIGKYGQGFKTGCFRLGASVTVITKKLKPATIKQEDPVARALGKGSSDASSASPSASSSSAGAKAGNDPPIRRRSYGRPLTSNSDCWNIGFLSLPGEDSSPSPFDNKPEWNAPATTHLLKYNPTTGIDTSEAGSEKSWQEILRRSPIRSFEALQNHIRSLPMSGTLIIISRLRKYGDELELQIDDGGDDIILPQRKEYFLRQWAGENMRMDYSATAYTEVLYRKPTLRIYVQDKRVETKLAEATLREVRGAGLFDNPAKQYRLYLGYSDSAKESNLKGVLMYHGNRLISSYQHYDALDVGYIGVLDTLNVRDIDVTNNKQDYEPSTKPYLELEAWIRTKCEAFTDHVQRIRERGEDPFRDILDDWVECDRCHKWRKYPYSMKEEIARAQRFECNDVNWSTEYNHCDAPEEEWEPQEWQSHEEASVDDKLSEKRKEEKAKLREERANFHLRTIAQQEPRPLSDFESQIGPNTLIGEGSFARVYRVIDPKIGELRALKHFTLSLSAADAHKIRDQFLREMNNQRLVYHRNVVSAVGWVDHDTNLCLLLEHVNGDDLSKILHGSGRKYSPRELTADEKHAIVLGIAKGLAAMHEQHIVHRDMKPQNVIVEGMRAIETDNSEEMMTDVPSADAAASSSPVASDQQRDASNVSSAMPIARVCDFGVARRVKTQGRTTTTRLSQRHAGTMVYSSSESLKPNYSNTLMLEPEDEEEQELNGRMPKKSSEMHKAGDVWSFGLVMLELLTAAKLRIKVRVNDLNRPLPFAHRLKDSERYTDVRMENERFPQFIAHGHLPHCDPTLPCLKPYLGVLSACIAHEPNQRSNMTKIVKMLTEIKYEDLHPEWKFPSNTLLYRVLSTKGQTRPNLSKGLYAKQQQSNYTPTQHVSRGGLDSHYISTTKSFNWALWYWCKLMICGLSGSRYGKPDTLALGESPYTIVIDLSQEHTRSMDIVTHDMKTFS